MPVEKNANYTALNFSSFTGGMNTAMPPEQIAENEAQYIENYEYDFNRLRTRGGLSAPVITINNDVISSFYYDRATDSYLIFGAAGEEATAKIYHADVNSVKEIGSLTGKKRPVCCKFGGGIEGKPYGIIHGMSGIFRKVHKVLRAVLIEDDLCAYGNYHQGLLMELSSHCIESCALHLGA